MMDRLTEKTIGCFQYDLKNFDHKVGEFGTYDAFIAYSLAVKKLGEYEDAEEQREQQPKTNGDRIRAMTDEELAEFFMLRESVKKFYGDYDISGVIPSKTLILENARNTQIAWLHWLKRPAEVDHDTD